MSATFSPLHSVPVIAILMAGTLTLTSSPAGAGFYFEGLEPYSIRACEDTPSTSDPVIALPPGAVEGSPSQFNDGGIPRFHSAPCAPDDGKAGSVHRPTPRGVPQK